AYGDGLGEEQTMFYFGESLRFSQDRPDLLPLRIHSLMGQSRFYTEQRQFAEAIPLLELADSLWAAHRADFLDHPEYHNMERKLLRLRGYYHKRNGDYELAIDYYQRYLRITEQAFKTPRAHRYVLTTAEIAWIYRELWKIHGHQDPQGYSWGDSTVTYIQKALVGSCKDYKPQSVADLPQVDNIRQQNFSFHILRTLARHHQTLAFDRGSKADKIAALDLAYAYMEVADQLFDEVLKESINLKGHINQSVLDIATLIYDTNNIFDHFLYELAPAEADLERAFYYVQKMKALQILLDQLNEEALEKTNLPDVVIAEDQAYLQAFHDLELQLYRAQNQKDSAEVDRLKNIDLFDLQRRYEAFQQGLYQKYPSYHLAKFEFQPTTLEELKSSLKEGELVLEYSGSQSIDYVMAISREEATLFEDISETPADAREAAAAI
ncbi:MAG: tetratricopeptide repeat protein, partial [Bacteroidota bacterium]